ncbi:hypothetical protein Rhopal_000242-T1 [Rhodotorula paludigena]|uniref:Proteophosphoglycan ppg4 n=1 Tax=Rhodotorula paludigena TaxID=86838 RepID=A0AAV5GA39_9BASI|nr:hypothetical protein Rhopal_000242-T1 [Rhodotorula paludigena]
MCTTSSSNRDHQSAPSPQRNHHRSSSPSRAAAADQQPSQSRAPPPAHLPPPAVKALRPQRPAAPVRLATPRSGYPFPVMVSHGGTPQEEIEPTLEPYKDAPRPQPPSRKHTKQGDGWDTPGSSSGGLSRASSLTSNTSSRGIGNKLGHLPLSRLTSAFSDASSSPSPVSSSSCSTPDDNESVSSPFVSEEDMKAARAASGLPGAASAVTTPADIARSRLKHAGSTPGAPPPAPLVHTTVADGTHHLLVDREDVRQGSYSSSTSSRGSSPGASERKQLRNPLAQGLAGLSVSSHSGEEKEPGVGAKWEVD